MPSRTPFTWQLYVPYTTAEQMEYAGLLIGLRGARSHLEEGARLYIEGDCRDSVAPGFSLRGPSATLLSVTK